MSTAGVSAILEPESIAVIGASDDRSKFGGRLAHIITHQGFGGALHFVTRDGRPVMDRPSYASVSDVPAHVDVAIMAIPATAVPATVAECGRAGVSSAVIISTGFGEIGDDGAALDSELLATVRDTGIRLMGPNCLGAVNAHYRLALTSSVSLAGELMVPGHVGLISQSGAVLVSLVDWLRARDRGFSSGASLGNQLDLDIADFLDHYVTDPTTTAVCAYIEGVPRAGPFLAALRRLAEAEKPVVIVKAGRTPGGAASVAAHTASFAGSYAVFRAACEEAGAILVDDPLQMIVMAEVLGRHPRPPRGGLAIVSTSGGAAGVLVDAATERGIDVADLGDAATSALAEHLVAAQVKNPVDLGGRKPGGDPSAATRAIAAAVAADPAVGVVLYPLTSGPGLAESTEVIADAVLATGTPLLGVSFLGHVGDDAAAVLAARGTSCFERMDDALATVDQLLRRASRVVAVPVAAAPVDLDAVDGVHGVVTEDLAKAVLMAVGIECNEGHVVADQDAAVTAATLVGLPAVMKVSSTAVVHKSEAGGVLLGLSDEDTVRDAWRTLSERFAQVEHQVMVQQHVAIAHELIVGAHLDEQFGPVVVVGAGGILVHVLDDVQLRLAPLSVATAEEMVRSLRMWPALAGARGTQPVDLGALASVIARFSQVAAALGDRLVDLEINPLAICADTGRPIAVDARAELA